MARKKFSWQDLTTTIAGAGQLALTAGYQVVMAQQGGQVNWNAVGMSAALAFVSYFVAKGEKP